MIQRIQSLFIILSISFMAVFLALPMMGLDEFEGVKWFKAWEVSFFISPYRYYATLILMCIAAGFGLIALFLYKFRSVQILFCTISLVFSLSAFSWIVYRYQTIQWEKYVYLSAWALTIIPVVLFMVLAIVYIRNDEKLIKSLDRMRD